MKRSDHSQSARQNLFQTAYERLALNYEHFAPRTERGLLVAPSPGIDQEDDVVRFTELLVCDPAFRWTSTVAVRLYAWGIFPGRLAEGYFVRDHSSTSQTTEDDDIYHNWIVLPDGQVVDPIRWTFESNVPTIYIGPADRYREIPVPDPYRARVARVKGDLDGLGLASGNMTLWYEPDNPRVRSAWDWEMDAAYPDMSDQEWSKARDAAWERR